MPKSYISKYRHQQPFLRSLLEGKGSVLKQLWERRVTSFLARKQQPKCLLHRFEFALLALLQRPHVHLLHKPIMFWSKLFAQADVDGSSDNASIALSWPTSTYSCVSSGWLDAYKPTEVGSKHNVAMVALVCT